MPLQAALSKFKADVKSVYENNKNTPAKCARGIANAVYSWAIQGVPMTTHTPALMGSGGIDKAAAGSGLSASKPKFQADIEAGFKSRSNTADIAAKVFTDAHMAFFSQAIIQTIVVATVTPPPGTPYTGVGSGGIDSSAVGKGLSAALPDYISTLTAIYANNSGANSVSIYAKKLADASYAFLASAKIQTSDTGATGAGGMSVSGSIT